jgi:hypothetical protein
MEHTTGAPAMTPAPADRAAMLARHTQIQRPTLTQDELDTLTDLLSRAGIPTLREVQATLPDLFIAAAARQ